MDIVSLADASLLFSSQAILSTIVNKLFSLIQVSLVHNLPS